MKKKYRYCLAFVNLIEEVTLRNTHLTNLTLTIMFFRVGTFLHVTLILGYTCDVCKRTYKVQTSLRRHKKYECQKVPQFKCDFCPYAAKQKSVLTTHILLRHNMPLSKKS